MEKIDLSPVSKVKQKSIRAKQPTGKSSKRIFFSLHNRETAFCPDTEFSSADQITGRNGFDDLKSEIE